MNFTTIDFCQPYSPFPMDPAVILLWLCAIAAILIGSLWATNEVRAKTIGIGSSHSQTEFTRTVDGGHCEGGELQNLVPNGNSKQEGHPESIFAEKGEKKRSKQPKPQISGKELEDINEIEHVLDSVHGLVDDNPTSAKEQSAHVGYANFWENCRFVLFLMASFIIGFLLVFFRKYIGHVVDVVLAILAIFALHGCLYHALKWIVGDRDCVLGSLRTFICCFQRNPKTSENAFLDRPIHLLSQLVYMFSIGIYYVDWFTLFDNPYAFLLHNPINFASCIYTIKLSGSRVKSLRNLLLGILGWFIFDLLFFGVDLLIDSCAEPLFAPIKASEAYHFALFVPMIPDGVQVELNLLFLELTDVISIGCLVAYFFRVDAVKGNRYYHTYGLISLLGCMLGIVSTFVGALLIRRKLPSLLYLVPFTLAPVSLWAIFGDPVKGTFGQMWSGQI